MKGQIRLAWEEIVGYGENIARRTTFVDDEIVSALFIAVRLPLQKTLPF